MTTNGQDHGAQDLYGELRGILEEMVGSVNRAAAGTVESALKPTKESHSALREAATTAARQAQDAREMASQMKSASQSLSHSVKEISRSAGKVTETLKATERSLIEHREEWLQFCARMEAIWSQRGKSLTWAIVLSNLLVLGTVVALFLIAR